ncbi:30S ribosomal protein S4 [Patescibacteria group bacterium]|nr:30S ribosomal protein S4 [Patescibacteria group bacterium]
MARYIGPKNKKARRIGKDLELTSAIQKVQRRLGVLPGQHGRRGRRKISDYGRQLLEKQRVKWTYGVLERQFRRYFKIALKKKGATGEELLRILESRLDNVIYRLALTPTRAMARQLITHGHARVDGVKVTTPSYLTKAGNVITLSDKAIKIPQVELLAKEKKPSIPAWLSRMAAVGKVDRLPDREEIDADITEQLIVELYSK